MRESVVRSMWAQWVCRLAIQVYQANSNIGLRLRWGTMDPKSVTGILIQGLVCM
jgi:hypothetical protein